MLETERQADWAIAALQRLLAYQVLLCHERYGDSAEPMNYGHRIPAGGPINGDSSSPVRFMALARPEHYPATGQLPSGKFDFLHVVGITEAERNYAKASSTAELINVLEAQGAYPVTRPERGEVALPPLSSS